MTEYVITDALGLYWTGVGWHTARSMARPYESMTQAQIVALTAGLHGAQVVPVTSPSATVPPLADAVRA